MKNTVTIILLFTVSVILFSDSITEINNIYDKWQPTIPKEFKESSSLYTIYILMQIIMKKKHYYERKQRMRTKY